MILWLLGALVAFVLIDGYVVINKGKERRRRGQPTIGDIWTRPKLQLESSGTMPRYLIEQAMEDGGQPAVRAAIEDHYKKYDFDDWSIDFCYSSYNPITKKNQSGFWATKNDNPQATVFFYTFVEPPPPPPPPPRPEPAPIKTLWSDEDERNRIALFLAGPSAFWLNPDWEGTDPFWMRDPAPLPDRFLPVDDRVMRAAEIIMVGDFDLFERMTFGDTRNMVYMVHDDGDFILTGPEYRKARRIALDREYRKEIYESNRK